MIAQTVALALVWYLSAGFVIAARRSVRVQFKLRVGKRRFEIDKSNSYFGRVVLWLLWPKFSRRKG